MKQRRRISVSRRKPSAFMPEVFAEKLLKDQGKARKMSSFFKGDEEISARKPGFEGLPYAIEPLENRIGYLPVVMKGIVYVKESASGRAKKKLALLESGILNIYDPSGLGLRNSSPSVLPPERSLPITQLRSIVYPSRGSKKFNLVFKSFVVDDEEASVVVESGSSSFSKGKEILCLRFKFSRVREVENWIAAILCESKNQAIALEGKISDWLNKQRVYEFTEAEIEGMMRQCVDLFHLSLGKNHKSTALAQEKLGAFLKKKTEGTVEGNFWCKAAETTRIELKKLNTEDVFDHVLQRARLIRSDVPLNQLKFQTECLYRLKAYKEKIKNLRNEAQKWKARALLYGYGSDLSTSSAPITKVSIPKGARKALPQNIDRATSLPVKTKPTRVKPVPLNPNASTRRTSNKRKLIVVSEETSEPQVKPVSVKDRKAKLAGGAIRKLPSVLESIVDTDTVEEEAIVSEPESVPTHEDGNESSDVPTEDEAFNISFYLNKDKKPSVSSKSKILPQKSQDDPFVLNVEQESNVIGKQRALKPGSVKIIRRKKKSSIHKVIPSCYLMLSPTNKGTLYVRWSVEDLSQYALAKFDPSNEASVPAYTYKIRSGRGVPKRNELITGAQNMKKMTKGVIMFMKRAMKNNSRIIMFEDNVACKVLGYRRGSGRIEYFDGGSVLFEMSKDYEALAVVPLDNNCFEGIKFAIKSQFLSRARKQGSAIEL